MAAATNPFERPGTGVFVSGVAGPERPGGKDRDDNGGMTGGVAGA